MGKSNRSYEWTKGGGDGKEIGGLEYDDQMGRAMECWERQLENEGH